MNRREHAHVELPASGGGESGDGVNESQGAAGRDAGPAADPDTVDGPRDRRRRILQLESELRVLRGLLDVRNEAFRALMARLVSLEAGVHAAEDESRRLRAESARLTRERDLAVELSTVLQNMKVFRYTKWPRAAWGVLLRLSGRR
jgi:hypothetical protein